MVYFRSTLLLLCAATQVTAQSCTLEDAQSHFCPGFDTDENGNLCPYGYWEDPDNLCPGRDWIRSDSCINQNISPECQSCFSSGYDSLPADARETNGAYNSVIAQCLAPEVPTGPDLCPAGTQLAADVQTPVVGECRHSCHSPDAWEDATHPCYDAHQSGTVDWNNNTCGIGECDFHTTEDACVANDGFWQVDHLMNGVLTCGQVESWLALRQFEQINSREIALESGMSQDDAEAYFNDRSFFWRMEALGRGGETCCPPLDLASLSSCTVEEANGFMDAMMSNDDAQQSAFFETLSFGCAVCLFSGDSQREAMSICFPERDFAGSCSDDDNAIYNNINDCEEGVVECTEEQFDALIQSFAPSCFQCLVSQDGGDGPPDITPCLASGGSSSGGGRPPPPPPNSPDHDCSETEAWTGTECATCPDGTSPRWLAAARQNVCTDCRPGFAGVGGNCDPCGAGTEQNEERTSCVACQVGFAYDGDSSNPADCSICPDGYETNAEQSACQPCAATDAGTAGTCAICPDGAEPASGNTECAACAVGFAGTGGVCTRCDPGSEPNSESSACATCAVGFAGDDGTCAQCPDASETNADQSACQPCASTDAGTGGTCTTCPDGSEPTDDQTACQDCGEGFAGTGGACARCPPAHEPTSDRSDCQACPAGWAGSDGTCVECIEGHEPNPDQTGCQWPADRCLWGVAAWDCRCPNAAANCPLATNLLGR